MKPATDNESSGSAAQRWLLLVLRLNALLLMSAFVAVVLPYEWMNSVHRSLGMSVLPDMPLMGYLTRSISFIYGLIGLMTWLMAADARRYWPLIGWWGWCCVAAAGVLGLVDVVERMPIAWILIEAPYLLMLGIVVLSLRAAAARAITSRDL